MVGQLQRYDPGGQTKESSVFLILNQRSRSGPKGEGSVINLDLVLATNQGRCEYVQ
jgi:hypothetical protein